MKFFHSLNNKAKTALCVFTVVALAFALRAPFFHQAVLNWDESTFLIIGHLISDGISIADSNTTAIYFLYSLFAGIREGSVVLPRVFAGGLVLVAALVLFLSHRKIDNKDRWAGPLLSALMFVVISSDFRWDGVILMKEIMNLPFVCFALFFLAASQRGRLLCFAAGCLFAAMVLVFPAMLFFSFAVFVLFLFEDRNKDDIVAKSAFLISGGILCTVLFLFFRWDNFEYMLKLGGILLSGVYSELSFPDLVLRFMKKLFTYVNSLILLLACLLPFTGQRMWALRLFVLTGCFLISVLFMGNIYSHHLLSVSPMLALMAGISASVLWRSRRLLYRAPVVMAIVWALAVQTGYYSYYKGIVLDYNSRRNSPYAVARYLNERGVKDQYVYFTEAHLGYLLTGARVPTKFIHPSAVFHTEFQRAWEKNRHISLTTELEKIFLKHPVFVVVRRGKPWWMNGIQAEFLSRKLSENYNLVAVVSDTYKRRKDNMRDLLIYQRKRIDPAPFADIIPVFRQSRFRHNFF